LLRHLDYGLDVKPDESVSGIERGIVTRIRLNDNRLATLLVATGAGYPPKPEPAAPTPVPPVPQPNAPPEEVHRPKFSIRAPAKVQEGEPLSFAVHREDSDGRPHRIALSGKPPELLQDALAAFDFSTDRTDEIITVNTARGHPGDGDHKLEISLATDENADLGDPAIVLIVDTPAATYEVVPAQDAERGQPLSFEVAKTGPASASELDYEIQQGQTRIWPDGLPHPLRFAAGETSKRLDLPSDFYSLCGPPPTLILHSGSGQVAASATFSAPPPEYCAPHRPTLFERLQNEAPWWPIPIAVLALGAVAYGLKKIIWPSPPALYSTWAIETPVPATLHARGLPGWPRFSTRADVEWGGAIVPEPLPTAENKDG